MQQQERGRCTSDARDTRPAISTSPRLTTNSSNCSNINTSLVVPFKLSGLAPFRGHGVMGVVGVPRASLSIAS